MAALDSTMALLKPHLPNPACFVSGLLLSMAALLLQLPVRTRLSKP